MHITPSPPSARSLFENLSVILKPKSLGYIFCKVLDLFDVLRTLCSSALFVGVLGGEFMLWCLKVTGTFVYDFLYPGFGFKELYFECSIRESDMSALPSLKRLYSI